MLATPGGVWVGGSRNLGVFRNGWWSGFLRDTSIVTLLADHETGAVWEQ